MSRKIGVLFASFEAVPFVKTGGLGDVAGSLPKYLNQNGCDARVILPKFSQIPEEYKEKMTHVADFYLDLSWRRTYCGIEMLEHDGVIYYFVDNEFYFKRDGVYGYFDDGERVAFYSKAVTECLYYLNDFTCDVLHCNDWHAALSPVFLREFYQDEMHQRIKTVFSVHNLKFQGQMSDYVLGDILGLAHIPAAANQLRSDKDSVNFMKGAVCYSDLLSTVSPTYAGEIQTAFFGEHMEGFFQKRSGDLYGILNGIDPDLYDPSTDSMIAEHYDVKNPANKAACKLALQKELGLEEDPNLPIFIMIGRLTEQKGLDLLTGVIHDMMRLPMQLVVLGTGDYLYEEALKSVANQYPNKMRAMITFDNALSHRMYAGGDVLLMPSLFEPCGLSQMMAMRYGTLPLVRETGGLKDSVAPYNEYTGEGTGFSFANYNAHEMLSVIERAVYLYRDQKDAWAQLQKQAMEMDFSWDKAAKEYVEMYRRIVPDEALADAVAEEVPTEAPAEEAAPAEEKKPVKKAAAKKTTAKKAEKPAEEKAVEKKPVKKAAAKKTTAKKAEKPAEEKPAEEKPVEEKPAKKAATKKTTAKKAEKAVEEKAADEKTAKKAPAKKTAKKAE